MKIRIGFITNSSSTNFLIISKEELTPEFLFKKLGFVKGGVLEEQGYELCNDIIRGINNGLRYGEYDEPTIENVKKIFGPKAAQYMEKIANRHVYWGYTNSDDAVLSQFFTIDSFEIEEKDFYVNGRSCVW